MKCGNKTSDAPPPPKLFNHQLSSPLGNFSKSIPATVSIPVKQYETDNKMHTRTVFEGKYMSDLLFYESQALLGSLVWKHSVGKRR